MTKHLFILFSLLLYSSGYAERQLKAQTNNQTETKEVLYNQSQLIGKWYFFAKDNDTQSKAENLLEGKTLVINNDLRFETDIFDEKEKGTWSFDKEQQLLILNSKSNKTIWKLVRIVEIGMVLINQETNESWRFSS